MKTGWHHTEEWKLDHSKRMSGMNNPFHGKHHTDKTKRKMVLSHPDFSGKNNPLYGKHHTDKTKRKMSKAAKGKMINEKSPNWKGDTVRYSGLHMWVHRNKPKPDVCGICNKKKPLEAANISGEYKRDINDFQWLCHKCHITNDRSIMED